MTQFPDEFVFTNIVHKLYRFLSNAALDRLLFYHNTTTDYYSNLANQTSIKSYTTV
jgi:hypothetical protein